MQDRSAPSERAFVLLVNVFFDSEEKRDESKALFAILAKHVKEHEPGTLSYDWAQSDKDPLRYAVSSESPAGSGGMFRPCSSHVT